ncbi:glycosyltransferase family 9 protein [Jiulongibacter sediminis]|uniref:Glycosyl transferase n=1 Tax=Jiulongibacter sediminis TaxID=1605367 RepID=A0A0P7BPS1_9BACT|nr:glycosyltransferase family 9 protein [Jiulongibacter sediminis]KPM49138.1 hypothetical protein AFM12_00355 [Jiulongibacter sediminis]TBX26194.1 hypothetical protein TK44_00355 [Jiulongibacter sediminis]
MRTFLVIRFSAMGDVLLTLPVLVQACEQNPDVKFLVLTRPRFKAFFDGYDQIQIIDADVDKQFKGLIGIFRLAKRLKKTYQMEGVLDLHQNLRSGLLKFFLTPLKSFTLDKGRADKKDLTVGKNKKRVQLTHSTERYAEVLKQAGIEFEFDSKASKNYFKNLPKPFFEKETSWIGIAPFAQHKGKIWPKENIRKVMEQIPRSYYIFLFGGGDEELYQLRQLSVDFPNSLVVGISYSMKDQLAMISALDVMICMDSSNMHLAALAGVKTVSIWGATHTNAGFGPYGAQKHEIVEVSTDELPCRPCSVYGNKPCLREDHACLNWITAEDVTQRFLGD